MVIHQVNVVRVAVLEAEDDPPISRHGDAPEPLQVAFERMEAIAVNIKIPYLMRDIEARQSGLYPINEVGANLASIAALVEPLEAASPKAPNHCRM